MTTDRTTPRPNHDRQIVRRAADTARRAGRTTIRRPDVAEAERHYGAQLTMGKGPKVRNTGSVVK